VFKLALSVLLYAVVAWNVARWLRQRSRSRRPVAVPFLERQRRGESTGAFVERCMAHARQSRDASQALMKLTVLGDERAPAYGYLDDPSQVVREVAATLISQFGDDAQIVRLRRAEEQHPELNWFYVVALCARGSAALDDAKEPFLRSTDRSIRATALEGLTSALKDGRGVARMVQALVEETDRELLLEHVEGLLTAERLDALTARWSELPRASRLALAEEFPLRYAEKRRAAVLALFERATADPDPEVQSAARRAAEGAFFAP
jgi:hypothetical protein